MVVFADYRFLAHKLDACGVLTCPVLTVLAVVLSGLGAGVRACAKFAGISFIQAFGDYASLLEEYPEVDKFVTGYMTRGAVLSVVAAIAEAHGGRATAESTDGRSVTFSVILP